MEAVVKALLFIHVAVGFVGLAAFWVPVVTAKGGTTHKTFGKIFKYCAYIVLASAAVALALRTAEAVAAGQTPATQPVFFGFMVFLAYLTLVTFVTVRHGTGVLEHKSRPEAMATPLNLWLARASIAATAAVLLYAIFVSPPNRVLLFALSPIGILVGRGILRYVRTPPTTPRQWFYEHLGAMLGGGIAFHTAFAVLGATRLFDIGLTGWTAVIPWIAPTLIGIPATIIWTRHYQKKFGELA